MEDFVNIDWHPSINDIVDNEFVNVDRLEKSSAMYRILQNKFVDPSENIYQEFLDLVKPQDVEYLKAQAAKKKQEEKNQQNAVPTVTESTSAPISVESAKKSAEGRIYVPGIVRCDIKFPRPSSLSAEQHAMCVKILKKFSVHDKPDISTVNKDELTAYMNLQSKVSEEQEEFLKLAKENWDPSTIEINREDLINLKWKHKLQYALSLHRYYTEVGTVPFVSEQEIKYNFHSTLLDVDNLPKFLQPSFKYPFKFPLNSEKFAKANFTGSKLPVKNQISEDENCQKFAESNNVDIVISSSGLQCLASNIDSSYSQTWILPIQVKEINGKNVVFIDKPLPPQAKNVLQKNTWIYKYVLKHYLVKTNNSAKNSIKYEQYVDRDKANDTEGNKDDPKLLNIKKQPVNNYQYNIFSIGACGLSQNEMMKHKIDKDYKILVRSKIDAIETLESGELAWVKFAPKLENQQGLGAEAVTLEEAAKQWISLAFTPDTYLLRIRVYREKGECIQYERRTPISINNELIRLYNVRGEEILALIYNITEAMTKMTPGKYLLRHTVRNGAFATIYKSSDTFSKTTIDLHAIYCDTEFRTIPNPPWPLIDKTLLTPALICFNRMPAMFYPSKHPSKNPLPANKQPIAKKKNKGKKGKKKQIDK